MIRLCAVLTVAVVVAVALVPSVTLPSPATAVAPTVIQPEPKPPELPLPVNEYINRGNRPDSVRATLASHRLPNLEGKWYFAGPFDNTDGAGFDALYPPEFEVDLAATYPGKNGASVGWKSFDSFELGKIVSLLPLFGDVRTDAAVYLYHRFESPTAFKLPLSFGSDDTLTVYFNKQRLLHEPFVRGPKTSADQDHAEADVRVGTNELLIKVCQGNWAWDLYVNPELPANVPELVRRQLNRDFPPRGIVEAAVFAKNEANHYKLVTIPLPQDCVLEVGGLAFRPDGKLLACTRRGEVWLIHNPTADDPTDVKMTKFATGLHEALGLYVESNNVVYVVQRPELTKLVDSDGDGKADEFVTVCDRWGVSGDYHEFAFGPARDKDGNFYVTLNVGFGGGHQAKAAWRGWCLKISPDGKKMEPYAYGLRSPNGIDFSPEGDLFYCDNQGEWVVSNKMHHIQPGKFFGHQAGLRWVKDSPFAGKVPEKVASGMWYDGTQPSQKKWYDLAKTLSFVRPAPVYPDLDSPCIWFPYGRMGKSITEPVWDKTKGKFGPFAGQCFVGDQTNSVVMRVALEQVNGVYQGACFPFRSGLQCGVNRISFAPDGSMFAGQTNRGWGSIGGKPYGLQRLVYTGTEPFEIHHINLTKEGFALTFTKPLDPDTVGKKPVSVSSYTYQYYSNYGGPEVDTRAEPVGAVELSRDGKTLTVPVAGLRKGRVYEFRIDGPKTADGESVLHTEAYYTLNELKK